MTEESVVYTVGRLTVVCLPADSGGSLSSILLMINTYRASQVARTRTAT